ncbi:MAG: O-antigen ligase family protein, partial [Veillonella sp.]|nr:O-antigen ligase family protein [Veillonella sp.]
DIHSNEYIMVLILFLSQIVMDMGMVSYESKSTYFYMMLLYLEVQILRKGRKHEVQQTV